MRRLIPVLTGAALLIIAALAVMSRSDAETAAVVPPPVTDEANATATTEVAVLAGGCFWGVQGVFQHVAGVTGAVSGYAGGDAATAHYEKVGTGATGHAESVRITFDPRRISYGRILQIYSSVAHDPTQLNYQGPDRGPQYRSTIFPTTQEQADIAKAYIAQLNQVHAFHAPVVTTTEPGREFYSAERYHQDFLTRHPDNTYILSYDQPKIRKLQLVFPDLYRSDPVLVAAMR
jgi:peptide-methionine (S)-S-oxide reductase